MNVARTINMITGRFAGGSFTRSARKRHLREVMTLGSRLWRRTDSSNKPLTIIFIEEDDEGVVLGNDDPMVITGVIANARVKMIFLDQGSSADILFMDAFKLLEIPKDDIKPFETDFVGFSGDNIRLEGYVELYLTIKEEKKDGTTIEKTTKVMFIVVDCPSIYNTILGRPSLKAL